MDDPGCAGAAPAAPACRTTSSARCQSLIGDVVGGGDPVPVSVRAMWLRRNTDVPVGVGDDEGE